MKIKTSRKSGFTLLEIMIIVTLLGLLAVIAIPNFMRARDRSQTNVCISNLRQINDVKQQWALETHKSDTAVPAPDEVSPYMRGNRLPACPASGNYLILAVNTAPACDVSGHLLQ
jgi:prepilin-type N-terminal cleavage/methylation domain-containing protein